MFAEDASTELENGVIEKNLKKLLTVSKSKFYMLRVNFPKAFEVSVDTDIDPSTAYDPLADRNSEMSMKVAQGVGMDQQTILNEDESEENRKKRDAIIEKDRLRAEAMDKETAELVKQMEVLKKVDEMNKDVIMA